MGGMSSVLRVEMLRAVTPFAQQTCRVNRKPEGATSGVAAYVREHISVSETPLSAEAERGVLCARFTGSKQTDQYRYAAVTQPL